MNIIANFILIPKWGAIGSAWAAVIAHFLSGFMLNSIVAPRSFRMQLRALMPFYPGWFLAPSMEVTK